MIKKIFKLYGKLWADTVGSWLREIAIGLCYNIFLMSYQFYWTLMNTCLPQFWSPNTCSHLFGPHSSSESSYVHEDGSTFCLLQMFPLQEYLLFEFAIDIIFFLRLNAQNKASLCYDMISEVLFLKFANNYCSEKSFTTNVWSLKYQKIKVFVPAARKFFITIVICNIVYVCSIYPRKY